MRKLVFVIPDMSWLYDYKEQFSLGMMYLSTVLKDIGWDVQIYDTNINVAGEIPEADVYGFSAVQHTYKDCISLAIIINKIYPDSKFIVGGPHATTVPEVFKDVFDSVFIGEAEDTIMEYAWEFEEGKTKKIYRTHKDVDLDSIYPDRNLVTEDYIRTKSIFAKGVSYDINGCTSIMFSRGCPYRCTFCSIASLYKAKLRLKSIDLIVEEIRSVKRFFNIQQFRVQDDTFTIKKSYLLDLCNELEKLDIFYRASTRVDHVDEEIVDALARSGCKEIGIGVEVVDDDVLKKLRKGVTVKQIEDAIVLFKKYKIETRCFFMIGLPFDTYDTVKADIDFMERNNIQHIATGNYVAFPGTEMYINQEKFNIKAVRKDACLNINSHLKLEPNILRYDMSEKEHIEIMKVYYDYSLKKGFIH